MSKYCRIGHDIVKIGDPDSVRVIGYDGGEDADDTCRKCGRADVQLEEPCVSLAWATPGGDQQIAYLARVSNPKAKPGDPSARLIRHLLLNHHWSPFEMASMCIEINTTRDISAQILRHRSFSFQEFSTRYADVEELEDFAECRFQDDKNRQNSFDAGELVVETGDGSAYIPPEILGAEKWWNSNAAIMAKIGSDMYRDAREWGIAKEVARRILPIGLIPTKIYMAGTVRSWLHYISERTKPGVQKEHRDVAMACAKVFARAFPDVWAAVRGMRVEEQRAAILMRRMTDFLDNHPVEFDAIKSAANHELTAALESDDLA